MKLFKTLFFLLLFNHSFSQKINGIYIYEPEKNSKSLGFEIEILNDSMYVIRSSSKTYDCGYSNSNKSQRSGKIKRKEKFYFLVQYDSISKSNIEYPVKITRKKIIHYWYNPRNNKKFVKAFELKKASI